MKLMTKLAASAALLIAMTGGALAQEVKIALDSPPDKVRSGSYVYASVLGEELKAAGFQIKELPVNTIGGEAERLDQTAQGLLEVNMADLGRAGQLDKLAFGFTLAYLFDSAEHLDKATVQSGLLDKLNAGLASKGVRVVSLVLVGGSTGIFNTKHAVDKPSDLADLRLRALDENQLRLFKAWGTNGVVIPMVEVSNAFQTGIADGYVNPPFVPFLFGHADVLKFYTQANISQSIRVAMVSNDWYKGLKPAQKTALDAAIAKAQAANRAWVKGSDETALAQLDKAGIKIGKLSPEGLAQFKDLSKTTYTSILTPEQAQIFIDAAAKAR